jgi:hypothetical protein
VDTGVSTHYRKREAKEDQEGVQAVENAVKNFQDVVEDK